MGFRSLSKFYLIGFVISDIDVVEIGFYVDKEAGHVPVGGVNETSLKGERPRAHAHDQKYLSLRILMNWTMWAWFLTHSRSLITNPSSIFCLPFFYECMRQKMKISF